MCHESSKLAIVFKHFSNILRTRLASASDKVYQLLAQGRWFCPGTPASSIAKTGRHDIAQLLLKVALRHKKINQSIKQTSCSIKYLLYCTLWIHMYSC